MAVREVHMQSYYLVTGVLDTQSSDKYPHKLKIKAYRDGKGLGDYGGGIVNSSARSGSGEFYSIAFWDGLTEGGFYPRDLAPHSKRVYLKYHTLDLKVTPKQLGYIDVEGRIGLHAHHSGNWIIINGQAMSNATLEYKITKIVDGDVDDKDLAGSMGTAMAGQGTPEFAGDHGMLIATAQGGSASTFDANFSKTKLEFVVWDISSCPWWNPWCAKSGTPSTLIYASNSAETTSLRW